ncbi:hypothetical protein H4R34_003288 [Dimargaris verticillata]|uniref:Uncharacterized protein n=1 Tax=Dimargaris verticillata TaxID=2761393 RepID=A0A9W8B6I2_9FUNG|nr:hypothetical protein H4R34_003288 [Dimargaris verticillata]
MTKQFPQSTAYSAPNPGQQSLTAQGGLEDGLNTNSLVPNNAFSNSGLVDKVERLVSALVENPESTYSFDDSFFVGRLALTEPLQAFYDEITEADNGSTLASAPGPSEAEGTLRDATKAYLTPANYFMYEQLLIELRKRAQEMGDRGAVTLFEQSLTEIGDFNARTLYSLAQSTLVYYDQLVSASNLPTGASIPQLLAQYISNQLVGVEYQSHTERSVAYWLQYVNNYPELSAARKRRSLIDIVFKGSV